MYFHCFNVRGEEVFETVTLYLHKVPISYHLAPHVNSVKRMTRIYLDLYCGGST